MRLSLTFPRLFVLLAALLSGLACSLFSPAATPAPTPTALPATVTPAAIPDTRPADFTVHYYWAEGSLAPPYHYEYGIDVAADGTVTLTFIPDYPGPDVPEWIVTVALDAAQHDALYAALLDGGLFSVDWQATDGPPVGGSSYTLTATADVVAATVPSYVIADQTTAADALAATVTALIPQVTWDDLNAQRDQYITDHSQ